jgi:hypothetical protein
MLGYSANRIHLLSNTFFVRLTQPTNLKQRYRYQHHRKGDRYKIKNISVDNIKSTLGKN